MLFSSGDQVYVYSNGASGSKPLQCKDSWCGFTGFLMRPAEWDAPPWRQRRFSSFYLRLILCILCYVPYHVSRNGNACLTRFWKKNLYWWKIYEDLILIIVYCYSVIVCSHWTTPRPIARTMLWLSQYCLGAMGTPSYNSIQAILIGLDICLGLVQCENTIMVMGKILKK